MKDSEADEQPLTTDKRIAFLVAAFGQRCERAENAAEKQVFEVRRSLTEAIKMMFELRARIEQLEQERDRALAKSAQPLRKKPYDALEALGL